MESVIPTTCAICPVNPGDQLLHKYYAKLKFDAITEDYQSVTGLSKFHHSDYGLIL
jgi:hypothetical protein